MEYLAKRIAPRFKSTESVLPSSSSPVTKFTTSSRKRKNTNESVFGLEIIADPPSSSVANSFTASRYCSGSSFKTFSYVPTRRVAYSRTYFLLRLAQPLAQPLLPLLRQYEIKRVRLNLPQPRPRVLPQQIFDPIHLDPHDVIHQLFARVLRASASLRARLRPSRQRSLLRLHRRLHRLHERVLSRHHLRRQPFAHPRALQSHHRARHRFERLVQV